ncbi:hypothetical protein BX600DRAFT_507686 [Xylariales sp. PMI_506]|nr:hypothetical protein BX600DRAFT_507686 [Xylariales sp. PMI_506]
MHCFQALFSLIIVISGWASAQGFIHNCTWRSANLTSTYLGMYCNTDNWVDFEYTWSWFDLDFCLTNNAGTLFPYESGSYSKSCLACSFQGSDTSFVFNCDCFNTTGDLNPSSYDLNKIIWNHNGTLGCYGYEGNSTHCGPQCDPGFVPDPVTSVIDATGMIPAPTGPWMTDIPPL